MFVVTTVSLPSYKQRKWRLIYADALKDIPAEILPVEEKAVEPETSPTAEPEHDSRQAPSVEPEASASTATPRRTEIPAEMLAAWKDKKSSFQLGYISMRSEQRKF